MLVSVSSIAQARKQSLYEQEISRILYQIMSQEGSVFCSVSYSILSKKGESLKVFLTFSYPEKKHSLLTTMNKKYLWLVKKEMVRQKKFAFIPQIRFFSDEKMSNCNL